MTSSYDVDQARSLPTPVNQRRQKAALRRGLLKKAATMESRFDHEAGTAAKAGRVAPRGRASMRVGPGPAALSQMAWRQTSS